MTRTSADRGAGTVLVVALVAVVLAVGAVLGLAAGAVVAAARAQTAADLAALAAGEAVQLRGAAGCSRAQEVGARHGTGPVTCSLDADGSVRVVVRVPTAWGAVERRAHAGPRPSPP